MLSSSEISRSMERTLSFVSSLRWALETWSRYFAISISMLSEMPSYFSMRVKILLNLSVSASPSSSRTMPNIRWMRSAKDLISLEASSTDSSGVFMMPACMKCRRNSSSSLLAFGLMILQTSFSRYLIGPARTSVFVTLNVVWKAASTKLSLAALAAKPAAVFGISTS